MHTIHFLIAHSFIHLILSALIQTHTVYLTLAWVQVHFTQTLKDTSTHTPPHTHPHTHTHTHTHCYQHVTKIRKCICNTKLINKTINSITTTYNKINQTDKQLRQIKQAQCAFKVTITFTCISFASINIYKLKLSLKCFCYHLLLVRILAINNYKMHFLAIHKHTDQKKSLSHPDKH